MHVCLSVCVCDKEKIGIVTLSSGSWRYWILRWKFFFHAIVYSGAQLPLYISTLRQQIIRKKHIGDVLYYVNVSSLAKYHQKVSAVYSWFLIWHTVVVTCNTVVVGCLPSKAKDDEISLVFTALSTLICIAIPTSPVPIFQTSPPCWRVGVPLEGLFSSSLYLCRTDRFFEALRPKQEKKMKFQT